MNATSNETTNFSNIIKKSVLENFASDISIAKILIMLAIAFVIGLFIYLLYKRVFSGVLYSKSFNVSLIGMTMITAVVIIAINSNLVLSLGMVGALSIVRFRTPIKDPTDLIFLFWAAVAGIVTGAGFYTLAAIGSVVVGLILFFFIKKRQSTPLSSCRPLPRRAERAGGSHSHRRSGKTLQSEAKNRFKREHRADGGSQTEGCRGRIRQQAVRTPRRP